MDWHDALAGLNLHAADDGNTAPEPSIPSAPQPRALPKLKIAVERKGRGGKTATIIYGFPDDWDDNRIAALASRLKQTLGTGGSARGGEILIQGDCTEKLRQTLPKIKL